MFLIKKIIILKNGKKQSKIKLINKIVNKNNERRRGR